MGDPENLERDVGEEGRDVIMFGLYLIFLCFLESCCCC